MTQTKTDTCECGRPEIGPKHCPVHGDGVRPVAPKPSEVRSAAKAERARKRHEKQTR